MTAFYLPLAISWSFMAIEAPICMAAINKLPDQNINSAGFNLMMALAIFFESPVIDLLSTSTTLSRKPQNYGRLSKWAGLMIILVTVLHAGVAFTPLYWTVTRDILQVPMPVAEATRLPMMIMSLWSAFVGWRRFLHGLMISKGWTKPVTTGTIVRIAAVGGVALALYHFAQGMDGLVLASIAMAAGVVVETGYIHLITRPLITKSYMGQEGEVISWKQIAAFHAPLTAATFAMIAAMPMVTGALARAPQPVLTTAGWQIAYSVLFLFRAATVALPETVIALYETDRARQLWRFSLLIGGVLSLALFLVHITGLDGLFFSRVFEGDPEAVKLAQFAMLLAVPQPFLNAMMSGIRGFLTAHHITSARLYAIGVGMAVLFGALVFGTAQEWNGILTGSVAMAAAMAAELAVLALWWRRSSVRVAAA